MLELEGQIQQIHDPVMAVEDGMYYVFSTGCRIPVICSPDKITWDHCGRVFERNPAWTREINPNLTDIWAPDISFFNDRWHLYYAVSNFGNQISAIALATNRSGEIIGICLPRLTNVVKELQAPIMCAWGAANH